MLLKSKGKVQINIIKMKLIKISSKAIRAARYLIFKLCSSCHYKREFNKILENIRFLPKLE